MDELVNKLIRKYKTNDPFAIALNMNISIRYADLGNHTRGIYHRTLRRRFIVLHNQLTPEWQRFICAHELGHDRLHKGINRFFIDEHSFFHAGRYERQANRFAVHLLTATDTLLPNESIQHFLQRNHIPEEVYPFYY